MLVRLVGVTPPPAEEAFTRYDVQAGHAAAGEAWRTVATGVLDPVDGDPKAPVGRTLEATVSDPDALVRVAWIGPKGDAVSSAYALRGAQGADGIVALACSGATAGAAILNRSDPPGVIRRS